MIQVILRICIHCIHLLIIVQLVAQLCLTLCDLMDCMWHARPSCLSLTPRDCSDSCPSSQWCHPTVSSSVIPFSSCLQSFPASGPFLMIQLFASGGQGIRASISASVLPMNIQDWFPLGLLVVNYDSWVVHWFSYPLPLSSLTDLATWVKYLLWADAVGCWVC